MIGRAAQDLLKLLSFERDNRFQDVGNARVRHAHRPVVRGGTRDDIHLDLRAADEGHFSGGQRLRASRPGFGSFLTVWLQSYA